MSLEAGVQFRAGTQAGPVLDPASVIQVLAGGCPGHPAVVVTGLRYPPGALRPEPIEGCYAVAYPSVNEQYPLVSASCAKMRDAAAAGLMADCRELAEQMARKAWRLVITGEARLIPVRTPEGMSLPAAT